MHDAAVLGSSLKTQLTTLLLGQCLWYTCTCTCTLYICMYIHIHLHVHFPILIHVHLHLHIQTHVHKCAYIYIHTSVYIYIYMYIYMYGFVRSSTNKEPTLGLRETTGMLQATHVRAGRKPSRAEMSLAFSAIHVGRCVGSQLAPDGFRSLYCRGNYTCNLCMYVCR